MLPHDIRDPSLQQKVAIALGHVRIETGVSCVYAASFVLCEEWEAQTCQPRVVAEEIRRCKAGIKGDADKALTSVNMQNLPCCNCFCCCLLILGNVLVQYTIYSSCP